MPLYWIPFTDPEAPIGEKLMGVIVIESDSIEEALEEAYMMGINPGGMVEHAYEIRRESKEFQLPRNRLLSVKELNDMGYHTEAQKKDMN